MSYLIIVLIYLATIEAARILVFVPVPSVSHQVVFRPLTQELVKRGHEVVVVTTDPAFAKGQAPTNLTEIDVHDISYNKWRKKVLNEKTTKGTKADLQAQLNIVFQLVPKVFELQVKTKEFQLLIKNKASFDLIIVEAFIKLPLSLSHVFKAPVIMMNSFGSIRDNLDIMGAPKNPPWLYPHCTRQRVYNLTIMEKIYLIYEEYTRIRYFDKLEEEENRIAKRLFGPDTPLMSELTDNVQMLFLNIFPIWELNRPVPSSVIFTGGLHQKPFMELPEDLKSYLDSSKHGVIYLSFGTNVLPSHLPAHRIQVLVQTLSKLPYDVLMKWDKDELPGKSENIRIGKWFPQSDLLRHPKIKLFITQGGLQSTDEALIAGVPLIGIPLLGDQWLNVEHYVHHKLGLGLDMETLTEDVFANAIRKVAENGSYRQNVIRLSTLLHDQPQPALDRAVWWTEHVLRHGGGRHLRAPAANMTWTQYLDVELLIIVAFGVLLLSFVIVWLMYALCCIASNFLVGVEKFKLD